MQRKPSFPVASCSIKMPDSLPPTEGLVEEDGESVQRRQQLINFGHSQWGFNNWSWSVTKQELDFVDFSNGKFVAGVCAYVSIAVKSLDIHRENIGYATTSAPNKGAAIYRSRKCAVTNALRETLLSFGGSVATELLELSEPQRAEHPAPLPPAPHTPHTPLPPPDLAENNQNLANKPTEVKNAPVKIRKDEPRLAPGKSVMPPAPAPAPAPPVVAAMPMPAALPPAPRPAPPPAAPRPPPPAPRPNSNEARDAASEEEARAERKRRQQRAQEEFRLKMMQHQRDQHTHDDNQVSRGSLDALLLELPSQDLERSSEDTGKRKSPGPDTGAKRRGGNRLDIVMD